jgi:hypothetical protein
MHHCAFLLNVSPLLIPCASRTDNPPPFLVFFFLVLYLILNFTSSSSLLAAPFPVLRLATAVRFRKRIFPDRGASRRGPSWYGRARVGLGRRVEPELDD